MKRAILKTAAVFSLLCMVLFVSWGSTAEGSEQGGVTGAEFLTMSPTPRYNAMGGVLDGLGTGLEGIHYNPALLSTMDGLGLQLSINPYPNDVTHSQASVGLPLLGGVGAVSTQLLNAGDFTYINEYGKPEETVSIYDAAATVGYSRYVWNNISVGASIKAIYRVLGEYKAVALGGDVGGAYWFETPHIGQRPKPTPDRRLARELDKEKRLIDDEREKRIQTATKRAEEMRKELAMLEEKERDVSEKIAQTPEEEKKAPLLSEQGELNQQIASLQRELAAEEERAAQALADIDQWHELKILEAAERHNRKISDFAMVENTRRRLFSVIDDPNQELVNEIIDTNIDETIAKNEAFVVDRRNALINVRVDYEDRRERRIEEIRDEIDAYKSQIGSEFDPEEERLKQEIERLEDEKAAVASSQEKSDKERAQELQREIDAKERELQALSNDPWRKRLEERIGEKEEEIAAIEEDMKKKVEEIKKLIEKLAETSQKEKEELEDLRTMLKRELKRAKLRRELDLLKTTKEKKQEKALGDYKRKEADIYLKLLSAMYKHEENILESRISAIREDSEARIFDFETGLKKERERMEEELAFQSRYIGSKISELEKKSDQSKEDQQEISSKIEELEEELENREEFYRRRTTDLKEKEKQFHEEEKQRVENEITKLNWQLKLTRLIYLQTDSPYLNTCVELSLQNFGTKVRFVEEGYPLPTTFQIGVGYALIHTDKHSLKLGVQANVPFHDAISIGVGAEYGFIDLIFVRTGYTFLSLSRGFSVGFGSKIGIGFTEYAVDYTFQPLPDYGLMHSFGVSMTF